MRFQFAQRFPDRGPTYSHAEGQVSLPRNLVARPELAGGDESAELVGYLVGDCAGSDRSQPTCGGYGLIAALS